MTPVQASSGGQDWFFDCDGVILESNGVKTKAFEEVASAYGPAAGRAMGEYHRAHGGVSRFVKWRHFFEVILGREPGHGEYEHVLEEFAGRSRRGVLQAPADPALGPLIRSLRDAGNRCHVVSGAAQDELREVLAARGIADLFDTVNGSPETKTVIVDRLRSDELHPGVFVGDSALDHEVAIARGLEFVFVTHWSEYDGWVEAMAATDAVVVEDLSELHALLFSPQFR